jgi:serine/threonine-protein kinase HipA
MLDTNGPDEADIDALTDQARHVLLGKELELDALVTWLGGGSCGARPKVHIAFTSDDFLRARLSITRDTRDVGQAFRRMTFNVVAHNRDNHSRQHAFLMESLGWWHLAPAYDLTFSHVPGGQHYMAVAGAGKSITREQVASLGMRHGVSPKLIAGGIEEVTDAIAA